jgi:hypothetical protein
VSQRVLARIVAIRGGLARGGAVAFVLVTVDVDLGKDLVEPTG